MFAVLLLVLFIIVIIFTLLGNIFVLVLSLLARKLPSPVNCVYVSLAVADILVAAFAMTSKVVDFGLHFTSAFGEEHLGSDHMHEAMSRKNAVCDVHHFLRLFACTASILHVCVVAIERCRSLDKPFGYMMRATYRVTIAELIFVWALSFASSAMSAIWIYQTIDAEKDNSTDHDTEAVIEGDCMYPSSAFYLIGSSLICFYIPLSVMFAFYCKIYLLARRQLESLKEGEARKMLPSKSPSGNWRYFSYRIHRGRAIENNSSNSNAKPEIAHTGSFADPKSRPEAKVSPQVSSANGVVPCIPETSSPEIPATPVNDEEEFNKRRSRSQSSVLREVEKKRKASIMAVVQPKKHRYPTIERLVTSFTPLGRGELYKKWQYYVNENKAVRTLGLLLFVFVSCWSPYFALNITFAIFGRNNVPNNDILFDTFIWLGFLNSAFNPMLYALSAKEYKQGVSNLLRNFGLCRNPSSSSTASTLSSRLLPARLRRAGYNNVPYYQRRRVDLARTILAVQNNGEDGGEIKPAGTVTTDDMHPTRLNAIVAEVLPKHGSMVLHVMGPLSLKLDDNTHSLNGITLTPGDEDAFLDDPIPPDKKLYGSSKSLQYVSQKKGSWGGLFDKKNSKVRRSLQTMVVVCGSAPVDADDEDDAKSATNSEPEACQPTRRPSSLTLPKDGPEKEEAMRVLKKLESRKPAKRTLSSAAAIYKQRRSNEGKNSTTKHHFIKNSRSVQQRLSFANQTSLNPSRAISTSQSFADAPHIAQMLIAAAINNCVEQIHKEEEPQHTRVEKLRLSAIKSDVSTYEQQQQLKPPTLPPKCRNGNIKEKLRQTKSLLPSSGMNHCSSMPVTLPVPGNMGFILAPSAMSSHNLRQKKELESESRRSSLAGKTRLLNVLGRIQSGEFDKDDGIMLNTPPRPAREPLGRSKSNDVRSTFRSNNAPIGNNSRSPGSIPAPPLLQLSLVKREEEHEEQRENSPEICEIGMATSSFCGNHIDLTNINDQRRPV